MSVKLAVIYYSSTGTNYQLAKWAEEGAKELGAEVRVLKVPELAPQEAINSTPLWKDHVEAKQDVPTVYLDDFEWADASFSVYLPVLEHGPNAPVPGYNRRPWFQGKLANKVVSAMALLKTPMEARGYHFVSVSNVPLGSVVAPGYTNHITFGTAQSVWNQRYS